MSSKNERKRKRDVDTSVDDEGQPERSSRRAERSSRASPPSKRSSRRHDRSASPAAAEKDGNGREESMSIADTNKLRAKLGLAPLDVDGSAAAAANAANKAPIELAEGEALFTEDGVSIVHKAPKNLAKEKETSKMKEKLDTLKQKRQIEAKVLKVRKGLADSDSDDDSAAAWVERNRKMEEARRKADEKAKLFDELDDTFGVGGFIEEERKQLIRPKHKGNSALTSGLVVGHSKEAFADGKLTILVLQDKGVLDDDDEEVLVNPNLLENERHKKNVELRKSKGGKTYNPYEENEKIDQFGELSKKAILDKYDEVLDGGDESNREKFRLDSTGGYDLDKEAHEAEVKRKLMMANKKFETLETALPNLAREFYTEEEMISFRRPKKKKDTNKLRKRKALKASDIVPDEDAADKETEEERRLRAEKLAARRGEAPPPPPLKNGANGSEAEATANVASLEDGELADEEGGAPKDEKGSAPKKSKWKEGTGASVDVNKLRELAEGGGSKSRKRHSTKKVDEALKEEFLEESESEDSSDDDFVGGMNLMGVVLEDDAEDELRLTLERTRRLKLTKQERDGELNGVNKSYALINDFKEEYMEMDEEEPVAGAPRKIVFDSTSEQYKTIGEIPTLGLAGNREGGVDYSTLADDDEEELAPSKSDPRAVKKEEKRHYSDIDSDEEATLIRDKKKKKSKKGRPQPIAAERGAWEDSMEVDAADVPSSSRHAKEEPATDSEDDEDYQNVLGEEKDVTKGVAAMLKLAGVKGYLENGGGRRAGDGTLKHLESQRFSRVEQGRYDIEDKTMRKLERMGTTGTGPVRVFPEKADYKPNVEVSYSDNKGRLMNEKEAFRALSWKFHGKGPGKKQIEKHQAQLEKKERLKKMNSMDTPLGTLAKQRKKQEQLQTPYLILSGSAKDGAPLQKD